jgi:hypothetical protein
MVGQAVAVGATGAAPAVLVGAGVPAGAKHNRPARRPVTTGNSLDAGPTQDARRHQILLLFAITSENPHNCLMTKAPSNQ